jgi:hypothetical protein
MSSANLVVRGVLLGAVVAALVFWIEASRDGAGRTFAALSVGVVTGLVGALAMRTASRRGAVSSARTARDST